MNETESQRIKQALMTEVCALFGCTDEVGISAITQKIALLNDKLVEKDDPSKTLKWDRFLVFNQKEIRKMPPKFQKLFKAGELYARVSLRADGVYCVRCRKVTTYGVNVTVYSKNLDEAKQKFLDALKGEITPKKGCKTLFNDYVEKYIRMNARKVVDRSTREKWAVYGRHIQPYVEGVDVKDMTASICYDIINRLIDQGKGKTAEDVRSLLNCAFKLAIGDGIINRNPLDAVERVKHERKHGERLSNEIIHQILGTESDSDYDNAIRVCLLTGIRPAELQGLQIDGAFAVVRNAKERKGVERFRKIPIIPMARPFVERFCAHPVSATNKHIAHRFHQRFPSNRLYDCRHTFTTVALECGCGKVFVDVWTGHKSQDMTASVYTHLSDEAMLQEAKKLHF